MRTFMSFLSDLAMEMILRFVSKKILALRTQIMTEIFGLEV